MNKELEKLKLILQFPTRYINLYLKNVRSKLETAYNVRKQIEKFKAAKDALAKELTLITEKITLFEAECTQAFVNQKFSSDQMREFIDRIQVIESKLQFLNNQPFINEFTLHGHKLLNYLIRKELFKIENILFGDKLMVFLNRNQFENSLHAKIPVGKLIIITSDYFSKQLNKVIETNEVDFFAQTFIYESFNFDDLKNLVKKSNKLDDLILDYRYITVIYITYDSTVAKNKINELGKNVDQFRLLSHSPEIFIKNYFGDLRRELTSQMSELRLTSEEVINEVIKEFNESERSLNHVDIPDITFKNIDLVQFLIEILKTEQLSEKLVDETRDLISRVLLDKQIQIKDSILGRIDPNSFAGKYLKNKQLKNNDSINLINDKYKEKTEKIETEKKLLEIKKKNDAKLIEETIVDKISSILSNKLMIDLMKLCNFPVNQKWRLLYRASEHGFLAEDFHFKCDGFKNTLTIIKSKNSNVFGGYTEADWSGDLVYKHDTNAFIFSLINTYAEPLLIRCSKPQHAIYCSNTFGPVFGFSPCDIAIEHNSNVRKSYSNLGCSYHHPRFPSGSYDALCFLAGSRHFQAVDIEVYCKVF